MTLKHVDMEKKNEGTYIRKRLYTYIYIYIKKIYFENFGFC